MYDYVLQYSLDFKSQEYIQSIKDHLKQNGIKDRERAWLPHITIDIYNSNNEKKFISDCDLIIDNINCFKVEFRKLNNCNGETLYIEPYNKEELLNLKELFDKELDRYMFNYRKTRRYIPHVTLCTSDNLDKSIELANDKFLPFTAEIQSIWVYNQDMELVKQYKLNNNNH